MSDPRNYRSLVHRWEWSAWQLDVAMDASLPEIDAAYHRCSKPEPIRKAARDWLARFSQEARRSGLRWREEQDCRRSMQKLLDTVEEALPEVYEEILARRPQRVQDPDFPGFAQTRL